MNRLELARTSLGLDELRVVNLFPTATYRTTDISSAGTDPRIWESARPSIQKAIADADAILLAYGVGEPNGPARAWYRSQLAWLELLITASAVPTFHVGGGPRHPSRWHRWTRLEFPEIPFEVALRLALTRDRT